MGLNSKKMDYSKDVPESRAEFGVGLRTFNDYGGNFGDVPTAPSAKCRAYKKEEVPEIPARVLYQC